MKLMVMENHEGEGRFPLFPKGTVADNVRPCDESPHWLACSINKKETFIPDVFLTDGMLNADYDPTELVLAKGAIVELRRIVYEWLYVKAEDGSMGWLPACKTVSLPTQTG